MDNRRTRVEVPAYSPGLFVNREEAIGLVEGKVRNILAGVSEGRRVIVFWGYRGAGKTWLLQHLAGTVLPPIPNVCAVYVNLQQFKGRPGQDAVRDIIGEILRALQKAQGQTPDVSFLWKPTPLALENAKTVLERATDVAGHVLVLLVDFVYEADAVLLELLEKHVLGPLVVKPRVVMVMAGRGQAHPWKTPQLRFQVEDYELKPFGKVEDTRRQLERQRTDAAPYADEIHDSTKGYPLANVIIPHPLDGATADQMRAMIDLLLEPIRNPDGSWPVERKYLEALCVLRTFDEERITVLLDAYDPSLAPQGGWTEMKKSEVLRGLIKTQLVRGNPDEAGWWIVDQAIRHLLEEYLRVVDPQRWQCCHQTAFNLYQDWVRRYPEEKKRWESEIAHHKDRLSAGGFVVP